MKERLLLWWREIGRAAQIATDRSVLLVAGCILTVGGVVAASWLASGVVATSWLSSKLHKSWQVQAVYGVLLTVAMFLALWIGLFVWHFAAHRLSRFEDKDWTAKRDDSAPGCLILQLFGREGAEPGGTHQLRVKNRGRWTVVENRDLIWYPSMNTITCHFHAKHDIHPGGFYEVRWFRLGRWMFVEVARQRFQLKNYSFSPLAPWDGRIPNGDYAKADREGVLACARAPRKRALSNERI